MDTKMSLERLYWWSDYLRKRIKANSQLRLERGETIDCLNRLLNEINDEIAKREHRSSLSGPPQA